MLNSFGSRTSFIGELSNRVEDDRGGMRQASDAPFGFDPGDVRAVAKTRPDSRQYDMGTTLALGRRAEAPDATRS